MGYAREGGANMKQEGLARRVSLVGLIANAGLTVMKLLTGILAHSGAMLSDAVNSASDVLSNLIVMAGLAIAGRKADREHPYGHDRFECVASLLLAFILFDTGALIGYGALRDICTGAYAASEAPGVLALAAALVCIVVKECLYRYTIAAARRLNSVALRACAWDHRSDVISSAGALIGIAGARLGWPILERLASLLICLFIIKAAIDIFRESVAKTVDQSGDAETEERLRRVIEAQTGVRGIDLLHTRQFGSGLYVDAEIAVDGALNLREAHAIAERVHAAVETAEPSVRHCMVHVNPSQDAP